MFHFCTTEKLSNHLVLKQIQERNIGVKWFNIYITMNAHQKSLEKTFGQSLHLLVFIFQKEASRRKMNFLYKLSVIMYKSSFKVLKLVFMVFWCLNISTQPTMAHTFWNPCFLNLVWLISLLYQEKILNVVII